MQWSSSRCQREHWLLCPSSGQRVLSFGLSQSCPGRGGGHSTVLVWLKQLSFLYCFFFDDMNKLIKKIVTKKLTENFLTTALSQVDFYMTTNQNFRLIFNWNFFFNENRIWNHKSLEKNFGKILGLISRTSDTLWLWWNFLRGYFL